MDGKQVIQALDATGRLLKEKGFGGSVRLFIAGGTAGLLAGLLRESRTTGDCDVLEATPEEGWRAVEAAAREVGRHMALPEDWLNRKSSSFAWAFPVGWQRRCERVNRFGPLDVWMISRRDLIASKIVSSPKRPYDVEDLQDMAPTPEELDFAEENLDRLETESLDNETFDDQRTLLEALRGTT